jgi:NADPH-dependent glutamate synthase beta subunit-like oxidoreductase
VAADNKGDISTALPKAPDAHNGKRIALIGAGPSSLTVARDLAPLGYAITLIDAEARGGGMIRSQIPRFRLPESVIDEEVGYIVGIGGIETRYGRRVDSLRAILDEGFDAIFVGTGAPRAATSRFPGGGRRQATSISASIGFPTSRSDISTRSAAVSSCSEAATPQWIVAAPPGDWAARR